MALHYWWLILGVLFLIGEIFTVDFSLSCFGLAFMAAALPAYLGAPFFAQAVCFAVVAMTLFFTLRPFALKYLHRSDVKIKTNADALAGRTGTATEDINEKKNTGRVRLDGDYWKAVSSENIPAGTEVLVEKIEGIILTVRRK